MLRLAPAALGHELALQERLTFEFGRERRSFEALLEVDAQEVRLLVHTLGQPAARLRWDGRRVEETRAPWLPTQVQAPRVLDDLQLVHWPAAAIRAALPAGWTLREAQGERELHRGAVLRVSVRYLDARRVLFEDHGDGYRLSIETIALEPSLP